MCFLFAFKLFALTVLTFIYLCFITGIVVLNVYTNEYSAGMFSVEMCLNIEINGLFDDWKANIVSPTPTDAPVTSSG